MKLTERLQQAKARREAGLAPPVDAEDEAMLAGIEVASNGQLTAVPSPDTPAEAGPEQPPRLSAAAWTRQGSCPNCAGESEIDLLDLVGGVMKLHCLACSHVWSVHRPD
jgi:hypothetical protein